ncbi:hypothetical protein M9H77_26775 [Catharanthus roseus]|uniref:Uncharacterized protein n=1 Tax=Catharanthus roseus TaxID=4058 RepID=A0ACC0AC16_CATRO|nr:hypothetical protein M9H77_26775 [Catharanthus roseus]
MEYVHIANEVDMWEKRAIETPLKALKRAGRSLTMRGATEERNNKPQVKAKVYTLDGLPIETEVEVVEELLKEYRCIINYHPEKGNVDHNVRSAFCIDYEMPELFSDDLVMGSGLCLWSPTIALYALLNLGVEAALMCLDSLKLPSCLTQDEQRRSKPRKYLVSRGTMITYSDTVNLVEGLGVSHSMSRITKSTGK